MAEALILKKNDYPTYFNKDALIGSLIAFPIGTAIGAYIGKKRMEEELDHGKIVTDKPSFWNKDTLVGGLIGDLVGGIAAAAAFTAATGASLLAVASGEVLLAAGTMALGLAVAAPLLIGGIALGIYFGGKSGQARQMAEYEEAKQQTIVEHLNKTVSPEVGKAVEYSMQHNKEWGKQVAEDRLLADAQQHQHHV